MLIVVWDPCNKVAPSGIFDYPALMNFDHNMRSIEEPIQTYRAKDFQYIPKVTQFTRYLSIQIC